ncbi:L-arabinitol 4-dehydrogenase [Scedosporium apiospermum]|uniref:L-arabinitol 4-dehydrogenase n=1 Tax=Pseudallescheria apiosperma TaxID=563466 RepID=A0A084GF21_PSEDA|nr:L-arabinitol 4-dehydrogenase [Scedosporium apiospermum]KEZ45933.1 L-arabinitol 4-dehydrogenase [Scedosporium apiospermum]
MAAPTENSTATLEQTSIPAPTEAQEPAMTTSTVEQPVAVPDAPAPEPVASEVEAGRAQAPETSAEETPTTEETKPTEASAPVQAPEPAEDSKPANELSEIPLPAVAEPDPAGDAPTAAEVERDAKQETSGPNEQKSNLSFILNKPEDLTFEERPIPKLKNDHEVLVAVNYTGICGSDVHYWLHGAIGHFVVKDPMVLGHESAGTVVETGSAVKSLKVGDRVALEPGYPCRHCLNCLGGRYNLCPEMRFAATPPYDGTLTGFWVAPADFCYKLPDNVSLQEGAMVEPLAVGVHIVKQGGVKPGDSVVIMGAGPVGLLCAAVARAFGASKVVSVDIVPSKLEVAKEIAATHTYISQRLPAQENAKALIEQCDLGEGADVVIDASGAEPSIQASLHVVKTGGTYVQGGMGKSDITFPIMALCIKEVTMKGSFRYSSGDYRLAVQLLGSGLVDVKKFISGVVPFKDAEKAFEKVKEGQVIKILIAGPNEKLE